MTNSDGPLLDQIDWIYVINLAKRTDRWAEMLEQLARIDMDATSPKLTRFDAVAPTTAAGFPSLGARGCFLSHLGVLQDAVAQDAELILLLEDDANFTRHLVDFLTDAARAAPAAWDMLYLGYDARAGVLAPYAPDPRFCAVTPDQSLGLTHAMLIRKSVFLPIIHYFEAMMARPAGDDAGGPMHVDGAYSWYRRNHPDVTVLATQTQWATQRSSETDIAPPTWKDHVPFIATVRRIMNRLNRD